MLSKEPKRVFSKRGSKSKQIVIEGTSSSFRTDSDCYDDEQEQAEADQGEFMIQAPDNKVVRELYRTQAD